MKKLTLFLVLMFLSSVTVMTFGRDRAVVQPAANLLSASDPEFYYELDGSDKDGFNLLVKYDGDTEKQCSVKVTVTLSDGSTKSFSYSNPVRKTSRASFGGEAGLRPAPIKSVDISPSCN